MIRILFVCLGNICRSPAAEGVFLRLLREKGLTNAFKVDSAGTNGYHNGELPDPRMRRHAKNRGLDLISRSRQFRSPEDFEDFDYIIVMDESNYKNIAAKALGKSQQDKIHRMLDFAPKRPEREVPDPYYGGADGFEEVLDIIEDASRGLLAKLQPELP